MKEKFLHTVDRYKLISDGDSILVALSGGPDSTLLLHLLNGIQDQYSLNLGAVYIDHQIRKRAVQKEVNFCRNLCEDLDIPFHLESENIPELSERLKKGLEETGRDFRYNCFEKLSSQFGYTKVALGHHADDRVETILFRIIRGTGKQGLLGIRPKRDIYIRPLFEFSKDEVLEYLKKENIRFCTDLSNSDNRFSRNYIRNKLFPELKKNLNRSVESSLLNLSETLEAEELFLDSITSRKMRNMSSKSQGGKVLLDSNKLAIEDLWLRRRIYRRALTQFTSTGQQVDKETIDRIDEFLFSEKTALSLPGKISMRKIEKYLVVSNQKKLSFSKRLKPDKKIKLEQLRYTVSVVVKDKLETKLVRKRKSFLGQFDYSKLTPPFTIRTIQIADRFSPLGLNGSKKIGDYLTDRKVSPVFRDEIPVLTDKNGIFWLVGYEIDNRAKIDKNTKEVLEIELNSEK